MTTLGRCPHCKLKIANTDGVDVRRVASHWDLERQLHIVHENPGCEWFMRTEVVTILQAMGVPLASAAMR